MDVARSASSSSTGDGVTAAPEAAAATTTAGENTSGSSGDERPAQKQAAGDGDDERQGAQVMTAQGPADEDKGKEEEGEGEGELSLTDSPVGQGAEAGTGSPGLRDRPDDVPSIITSPPEDVAEAAGGHADDEDGRPAAAFANTSGEEVSGEQTDKDIDTGPSIDDAALNDEEETQPQDIREASHDTDHSFSEKGADGDLALHANAAAPLTAPDQAAPSNGSTAWRDLSAFDELDESWVEPAPQNQEEHTKGGGTNASSVLLGSSLGSHPPASAAASSSSPQQPTAELAPIHVDKAQRRQQYANPPTTSVDTASALLRPGPSSPTYRLASHQIHSSDVEATGSHSSVQETRETNVSSVPPEHKVDKLPSSPHSGQSVSSSSSGEKRGTGSATQQSAAHVNQQMQRSLNRLGTRGGSGSNVSRGEETGVDDFGSAQEHISISMAGAVTAEEQTFIEHSEVTPVPDFMKPGWARKGKKARARDMFTPLKLETMFDPPSFVQERQTNTQQDPHAMEEQEPADEAQLRDVDVNEGAADKRDDGAATSNSKLIPYDKGAADDSVSLSEEHISSVINDASLPNDGDDDLLQSHVSSENFDTSEKMEQEHSPDSHVGSEPPVEVQPTVAPSLDAAAVSSQKGDPPECAFTFTPPPDEGVALPPPTPSASHAPLRLFRLQGSNSEVEQIINTPRSAARSADAKRIVWELVGEEGGRVQRERKRLRMDRLPTPKPTLAADVIHEESEERENAPLPTEEPTAHRLSTGQHQTRTNENSAFRFMERLQNLRNVSGPLYPPSSSLLSRRGAQAPTPEASILRKPAGNANLSASNESPRKLLRRWSAAHEIDEEIENEVEAEAVLHANEDEGIGGEIFERSAARPVTSVAEDVPDVQVESPTDMQRGRHATFGRVATSRPESLHTAPKSKLMDHTGAGDFVERPFLFDTVQDYRNRQGGSVDDRNDPFRDFEVPRSSSEPLGEQARPDAPTATAARRQSGLRNEIQLTLSDLSTSQTSGQDSEAAQRYRSPLPAKAADSLLTPPARMTSALPSATPRSILKTSGTAARLNSGRSPSVTRQAARSISFADGINPRQETRSDRVGKVEDLLRQLAVLALGPDDEPNDLSLEDQLTPTRPAPAANGTSARSPWNLSILRARQKPGEGEASFLTNASFDVAHDRLLELITDVAPFEEDWRELRSIDLRGRRVDSLNRLKEFLPRLEEVLLDDNEITYLSGLPTSLRVVSLARNRLPSTAAFNAFTNLETLDVSHNSIDIKALDKLVHLRHLRANENNLKSLDGIQHLAKLETLHLRNNRIESVAIVRQQWPMLKDLVLAHNKLEEVRGLGHLRRLRSLNLDHNFLREIDLGVYMPNLRQLRVSGNADLSEFDAGPARRLRTLYADDCALDEIGNIGLLQKLDNLSLRQQQGARGLHWPAHEIRDVKRLFLSGNAFRAIDLARANSGASFSMPLGAAPATLKQTKFYGMVYLELSACQLTALPAELADMVPNLRHLNADYNLLEALPSMSDMKRLKRLSMVGCRLDPSRRLVESLYGCDELISLDVRMNPCTLGLYPPILMIAPLLSMSFSEQKDGKATGQAFLPPMPHPSLARPDRIYGTQNPNTSRGKADNGAGVGEKSFFHKRRPPPPLPGNVPGTRVDADDDDDGVDDDDDDVIIEPTIHGSRVRSKREVRRDANDAAGKERGGTAFVASDDRFVRTLPPHFRLQRLLHRGTLAMACPSLTWLDGLLIDEDEVRQADQYYQRRMNGGWTRGPADRGTADDADASDGGSIGSIGPGSIVSSSGSDIDSNRRHRRM